MKAKKTLYTKFCLTNGVSTVFDTIPSMRLTQFTLKMIFIIPTVNKDAHYA